LDKLYPYYKNIKNAIETKSTNTYLPLSIQLNILNKCYQRCIGCRKPDWPDVKLPKDIVLNIIQWANFNPANTVVFSGGDPPAHENFIEFLETAHNIGLGTGTLTACLWGSRFNTEKFVINSNWISISIDGASEKIYTATRGVNTLKSVKENIKLLNKLKNEYNPNLRIRCNSTISTVNIHEMKDILTMCNEELEIENNFYPLHTWSELQVNNIDKNKVKEYVDEALCVKTKYKTNIKSFISLLDRKTPPLCIMPWVHIFCDANGDILNCCRMARDNGSFIRDPSIVMGNVLQEDINKIWISERAKKIRNRVYNAQESVCKMCDRYNVANWNYDDWLQASQNSSITEKVFL